MNHPLKRGIVLAFPWCFMNYLRSLTQVNVFKRMFTGVVAWHEISLEILAEGSSMAGWGGDQTAPLARRPRRSLPHTALGCEVTGWPRTHGPWCSNCSGTRKPLRFTEKKLAECGRIQKRLPFFGTYLYISAVRDSLGQTCSTVLRP